MGIKPVGFGAMLYPWRLGGWREGKGGERGESMGTEATKYVCVWVGRGNWETLFPNYWTSKWIMASKEYRRRL